jgi:hypothetical protein
MDQVTKSNADLPDTKENASTLLPIESLPHTGVKIAHTIGDGISVVVWLYKHT